MYVVIPTFNSTFSCSRSGPLRVKVSYQPFARCSQEKKRRTLHGEQHDADIFQDRFARNVRPFDAPTTSSAKDQPDGAATAEEENLFAFFKEELNRIVKHTNDISLFIKCLIADGIESRLCLAQCAYTCSILQLS